MPSRLVGDAQAWLRGHEDELLDDLLALLRIPSVESEPLPGAPYGEANRQALDKVLQLGQGWGMRTKDVEGHCGYAEFGEGGPMVMSMGHLDVVPVGPGWKHEPFGAELDGGYVYARGAVDDKGPTMASFYAMRAIQECGGLPGVRFRSFFGCNEESGFGCVKRYVQTEEPPTFGVAPDSGWPLYHGEKGIADIVVERPLVEGETRLLELRGGQRSNIVPDSCTARLLVPARARPGVEQAVQEAWDANVSAEWQGEVLVVSARGKAAHGGYPFGGDNAVVRAIRFLKEAVPDGDRKAYAGLAEIGHIGGDGLGLTGADEPSGPLSANLGIAETQSGRIRLTVNVRYPVTWGGGDVRDKAEAAVARKGQGYRIAEFRDSPPLYFPVDHPMVRAICDVYEQETGEAKLPGTISGGTYARAMPNSVSIGTGWEGDGEAHETDERLAVASLHKMARIYAHILVRLGELARG
jgi:succinyl-diaminopimelate desuccinylase